MLHILGISGSLRSGSFNSAALDTATEVAPDDVTIERFELHDIPMFDADLEKTGMPTTVADLRRAITQSHGLLISSPEYNGSVTGALKNALDWASRGPDSPLDGKPVAIMGAGGRFGTLRSQLHLREILTATGTSVVQRPQVYIDRPADKTDDAGKFSDPRTRDQIDRLLAALVHLIRGA